MNIHSKAGAVTGFASGLNQGFQNALALMEMKRKKEEGEAWRKQYEKARGGGTSAQATPKANAPEKETAPAPAMTEERRDKLAQELLGEGETLTLKPPTVFNPDDDTPMGIFGEFGKNFGQTSNTAGVPSRARRNISRQSSRAGRGRGGASRQPPQTQRESETRGPAQRYPEGYDANTYNAVKTIRNRYESVLKELAGTENLIDAEKKLTAKYTMGQLENEMAKKGFTPEMLSVARSTSFYPGSGERGRDLRTFPHPGGAAFNKSMLQYRESEGLLSDDEKAFLKKQRAARKRAAKAKKLRASANQPFEKPGIPEALGGALRDTADDLVRGVKDFYWWSDYLPSTEDIEQAALYYPKNSVLAEEKKKKKPQTQNQYINDNVSHF